MFEEEIRMSPQSDLRHVGNFENPGGWHVYYPVLDHLQKTIEYYVIDLEQGKPYVHEHDHFLAALDMFAVTVEHCGKGIGVKPELVRHWRDVFMSAFDREFGPEAEQGGVWAPKRRIVILDVFARLERVADLLYRESEERK